MSIWKTAGEEAARFLGLGAKAAARGVSKSKAFAEMASKNVAQGGFRSMGRATKAEQLAFQAEYKNRFYLKRILNNANGNKYLTKNFIVDNKTGRIFKKLAGNKRGAEVSARDIHNSLVKQAGTKAVHGNKYVFLKNNIDKVRRNLLNKFSKEKIVVRRAKYRVKVKGADGKVHWETRRIHPAGEYKGKKIPGNEIKIERPVSNRYSGFKEWNARALKRDPKVKFGDSSPRFKNGAKAPEEELGKSSPMDVHPKTGPDGKTIPPKEQQEHWWRNNFGKFVHHAGKRALTFAEKHPAWAILTPLFGYQYLQAQMNGRDMLTQLQGTALGWETSEDGTKLGAKGLAPFLAGLMGGTNNPEQGVVGSGLRYGLGEGIYGQGARVWDDGIGAVENVGHRIGKAADNLSDMGHKGVNEVSDWYNAAKDKAYTYPSQDGESDGETTGDGQAVSNGYSGSSVSPTRQNVDYLAMGTGLAATLLGKSWSAKLLGAILGGYGFEHNRKSMGAQQQQQMYQQPQQYLASNTQQTPERISVSI